MLRSLVASILCSGLVFGSASAAAAIDYVDPVVPPEFLLGGPPAPAPIGDGTARLLAQGLGVAPANVALPSSLRPDADPPEDGSVGTSWARYGVPGSGRVVPNNQWTDGGGGCALWDWASC